MAAFKVLLNLVCIFGIFFQSSESVCTIDLQSELRDKSPLILHSGDTILPDGTAFLSPRMNSTMVTLHSGEELKLLCSGADNRFNLSGEISNDNQIEGHCVSDSNFNLNQRTYSLRDVSCTQEVQPSIKHVGSCNGGNKRLQIGFPMPQNQFLNLIDICFNEDALFPSYLNYTLVEGIERRQMIEELDNPDKTDYYSSLPNSPNTYYSCSNQQSVVGSILGSRALATQNIVCSEPSNYLVKTYLASTSDFVYHSQQNSARYFVNTIPMWLSIANGNWEKLENEIRLYASNVSRESSDLVIYSGTLGVTSLQNNRRAQTSIYLTDDNKLPVPQWVWKLVYEPQVQEGIVFILVNNPYRLRFAPCSCVCAQTKWTLEWNRQDRSKGYVYCCTVQNFRNVFSGLPQLEVTGLLTKNRPYSTFSINVEPQK